MRDGEVKSWEVGVTEGILQRLWRKEPRDGTDVAWGVRGR